MQVDGDKDEYIQYCLRETVAQLRTFPETKSLPKVVLAAAKEPSEPKIPYWLRNENRELWELGRQIYSRDASCMTCHQKDGNGLPPAFPPLSGSEWLQGSDERIIKIVLNGLAGPIEVKQKAYRPETGSPPMPALRELLTDREIAAVLIYVRNAFGNRLPIVSEATVAKVRAQTKDRSIFWTAEELLKAHPLPVPKSGK
jgi:mono/diheme cytochrome c family protein